MQCFESVTLKPSRCSDAPVFQSLTWKIVNVASPLTHKQSSFECAAEALGDSAFGLHLAQQANLREAGVLFYVTSAARTLGETLPLYERYCRIVNEAVRVKPLRIQNGLIVEINFVGLSRHHFRHNAEFILAANLKGMRESVGRNIRPIGVTFAHPRSSNLPEFERFFGCPVEYGSASDQWSFSNETLAVPLISGDPYLLQTLQPFCDEAARERNTAVERPCGLPLRMKRRSCCHTARPTDKLLRGRWR